MTTPPVDNAKLSGLKKFYKLIGLDPHPSNAEVRLLGIYYSRSLVKWGVELQRSGNYEAAAKIFVLARKLNARNVVAEINLDFNEKFRRGEPFGLEVDKRLDDIFGESRSWEQVLNINGPYDTPGLAYQQGCIFLQGNQVRQAAQYFDRTRQQATNDIASRLWLGQIYLNHALPDRTIALATEIRQIGKRVPQTSTNLGDLFTLEAAAYLAKNDDATAQQIVTSNLAANPNNFTLISSACKAFADNGRYAKALELTERLIKLEPDNVACWINRGCFLMQVPDYDGAIQSFSHAITLKTNNYQAVLYRAIAQLRAEKYDAAIKDYETVQRQYPKEFTVDFGLGEIAYRRHETNTAIRYYESYLNNAPPNTPESKAVTERLNQLKGIKPPTTNTVAPRLRLNDGAMRVTHIITRLVVGGAQENTIATVLGLQRKPDVQVQLISGPTTGPEGSLEDRVKSQPGLLTIVPPLIRQVHPWKDFLALRQLTSLLRNQKPEIVHTHSGKAGILGRLAAAKAGVPIIIHHIHGPSFGNFQGSLANFVFTAAERYAGKLTTHFVCSAHAMTKLYLAAGIGRPEMFTRVWSGFDIEPFLHATNDQLLRDQLRIPREAFVLGKIARLFPLKGHDDVLNVFQKILPECPHAHLLFVGDGILRPQLEARVRALNLTDKVTFTGLVPPGEVSRYVGIMDCLVHLSSREALARALPQALAAGKPVIAYDYDGANEMCLDNQTGFLVRFGHENGVAERILLLARDPKLRAEFGTYGRSLVCENFPVEKMVATFYHLYQDLLTKHRPLTP
ncbi:MAG: glycosyltransferase [Verrucomicrobiota bacterium]